jgi:hypothetical protein
LPPERDENRTVWVFVDPLETVSGTPLDNAGDEERDTVLHNTLRDQVATLRDQVRYLQAEGERKDAIIMTMAQRIPELEPAAEPREDHEKASRSRIRMGVPRKRSGHPSGAGCLGAEDW